MRYFFEDVVIPLLFIVFCIAAVLGGIIGLSAGIESYQCSTYEKQTGVPTRYAGLECYVKPGDAYVPMAQYKIQMQRDMKVEIK